MSKGSYAPISSGNQGGAACLPAICTGNYQDVHAQPASSSSSTSPSTKAMQSFDLENVKKNPYAAATSCLDKIFPFFHNAWESSVRVGKILEPYRLGLLLPAALGLILCFFGGSYMTLIAAIEAYRIAGWETQAALLAELSRDMSAFIKASLEDDKVDADGDGIPDVQQVSVQDVAQRKALLFLKTVDPRRFGEVIGGLQSGLFAVVATLKLEFAKAVTLGTVIQRMLQKPTDAYIVPLIEAQLPADYRHWASELCTWAVKAVTISIAFTIQRVISAYYSAMRGGLMFSRNLLEYLDKMGLLSVRAEDTIMDEVAGYLVAGLGLYWQLSHGFTVPFPINVLLIPASLAEWCLLWLVNTK